MNASTPTDARDPALSLERLRADIAQILGESPEEIADDDNLVDHGLDSMRVLNLASRWSETGVEIPFAELMEQPTLNEWWARIDALQRRAPEAP
ncbi:phosphopantetheine-binding protein [Salinicola rhizosphaerae]|uniref:Carrier domain-containing protein n=1 Tax=Salinicola rhizosphaerae TaxID=1443141 RepID=A0ABQ3EAV7_9GAMM|nr:phosphopantetheine-binding protein [Salinicola rhizosphaerae]GHB28719.1 hypothetical protein GCM10009038_29540 [Salinicola rhizosphaerae]